MVAKNNGSKIVYVMVSPTPIRKQKSWSNWDIFPKFKTLKSEPNFLKYQSIQTVPKKSQVLENDDTEILIWKTMEQMGNHLPLYKTFCQGDVIGSPNLEPPRSDGSDHPGANRSNAKKTRVTGELFQ